MLKMGIVGMGKMGEFHASWMTPENQLELTAICEKNEDRIVQLRKKFPVPIFQNVDQFLNTDIDFAVIVTTHESHEALTIKALNAGKNVIVEKPMSMTYESTIRMIEAAERNQKHLFVHQSSRWDRDFLLLKEVIQLGKIGELLLVESNVTLCDKGWPSWGIEGMKNPWRVIAQYGGGMLYDWGPHLVDEILVLMGKDPLGVYGVLQNGIWSKEVDDTFFCSMRFENNIVCIIKASNNGRLPAPRWYVMGTRGTFIVQGRNDPIWNDVEILYEKEDGERMHEKIELIDVKESGIEGGFYRDLVPFLEGKKKEFVSMYESSKVIKVLEMIKKSSQENRFIPNY